VAVTAGVFVITGWGMGVNVAGGGNGVTVGITAPDTGVALKSASIVCAAAVTLAFCSCLPEGRLHALINKAAIINMVKERIIVFIIFFSFKKNCTARRLGKYPPSVTHTWSYL
jgi:hypothetical protein